MAGYDVAPRMDRALEAVARADLFVLRYERTGAEGRLLPSPPDGLSDTLPSRPPPRSSPRRAAALSPPLFSPAASRLTSCPYDESSRLGRAALAATEAVRRAAKRKAGSDAAGERVPRGKGPVSQGTNEE